MKKNIFLKKRYKVSLYIDDIINRMLHPHSIVLFYKKMLV